MRLRGVTVISVLVVVAALVATSAAIIFGSFHQIIAFLLVLEALIWLYLQGAVFGPQSSSVADSHGLLKNRLIGYAKLKGGDPSKPSGGDFGAHQFEVSLGIAKKVEAKAAALLTIWAIFVTAIGVMVKDEANLPFVILVALPPMLALIFVFKQRDNFDVMYDQIFFRDGAEGLGPLAVNIRLQLAEILKKHIEEDVLLKEVCYRFAYYVTFLLLSFALLCALAICALDVSGLYPEAVKYFIR